MVSRARDGQYLVDYAAQLGYATIEGSSHRGRFLAMRGSLRALKAGATVSPEGRACLAAEIATRPAEIASAFAEAGAGGDGGAEAIGTELINACAAELGL